MRKSTEDSALLEGVCVLVVEDQYLIAEDVRRAVGELGGRVLGPCPDLERARAALESDTPGLALLDVNLGEERVFPLADELAARGVPFIFTTGYEGWVLPEAHRDRPRLEKPVTAGALRGAVERLNLGRETGR